MLRPSTLWLALLLTLAAAGLTLGIGHSGSIASEHRARLAAMAVQAARLDLTDLCLFTEAAYTRHPSQADYHAAFQNHPMALEHFPSGALVQPPPLLRSPLVQWSSTHAVD